MLPKLVFAKMQQRDLSLREAANEIGLSHQTVARILNGESVSVDSLDRIAQWLGVDLATILDVRGELDPERTELHLLLGMYPKLEPVFHDLYQKIRDGELDERIIDEIVAYIKFRTGFGSTNDSNQTSTRTNQLLPKD